MRGQDTPIEQELEWRKHYLVTGNVAGSAKAVGLPIQTGYECRKRALADTEFVAAQKALRDRVLPDAEQMAVCAIQICMERLNKEPPDPMRLAELGADRIHIQDAGPAYAASLAKLFQVMTQARRFEAESSGQIAPEREVRIVVEPLKPAAAPNESEPALLGTVLSRFDR